MIESRINTNDFSGALRQAIKFAGCRQKDFAQRLGVGSTTLSTKLNGKTIFTVSEIKRCIVILAELEAVNRREEVLKLLELAGLRSGAFSQPDWETKPLNQLD